MVATTGGIADGASRSVHRYPAGAARGSAWTSGRDRAPLSGWRGGAALPGWCGRGTVNLDHRGQRSASGASSSGRAM